MPCRLPNSFFASFNYTINTIEEAEEESILFWSWDYYWRLPFEAATIFLTRSSAEWSSAPPDDLAFIRQFSAP